MKKEEPRAGKRKAIEESEDEEDSKKNDTSATAAVDLTIQSDPSAQISQPKEQKETIVRANAVQAITGLLSSYNIPLQSNKNVGGTLPGGRKNEDGSGKSESKRKKQVHTVCTALFLNNNEVRTIRGLRDILNYVMFQPENLEWLDLSYNYLEKIEDEVLKFPNLKTLYLHGNYIANLSEVKKLQDLPCLQTLTLYGNFVE